MSTPTPRSIEKAKAVSKYASAQTYDYAFATRGSKCHSFRRMLNLNAIKINGKCRLNFCRVMLVELRNTVFVNSTNIATNIETAAPLNSNNDNVEQKCSKFEVEGIIVVECRKYCSSARILPAVSESQGCGKMFEENAFFRPR